MTGSFRIVPGDPRSSVIIHVPHASRRIPIDVRKGILLNDFVLEHELDLMTDAFTDVIASRAAAQAKIRPWLFINELSRLVVDPERFPDEREEMNAVGMGAVYTRTASGKVLRNLPVDEISGLVGRYYAPYAGAFENLVDGRIGAVGGVSIIDLHSYPLVALPYEVHADRPRPEVCLGVDAFHTPPTLTSLVSSALLGSGAVTEVADDGPFEGTYVPLKHYGVDERAQSIMIELRRDLYTTAPTQLDESVADALSVGLARIADRCCSSTRRAEQ